MTNSVGTDAAVSVAMASFIVWLAHQHPPQADRLYCPEQVERFLRWQQQRRAQCLPHHDADYYAYLRGAGAGEGLIDEARIAIARLRQYLLTTP